VIRRGLDAEVLVNNCGTIDLCDIGPNIVVYPDNLIYRGVTVRDIPDIVAHLRGGPPVERLLVSESSAEEETRRGFYAELIEQESPPTSDEVLAAAAQHGFENGWIDEQLRRGFLARKPAEDGSQRYAATKKALNRYRLSPTPLPESRG
jgi:(2Fe-2S) ferredoxin